MDHVETCLAKIAGAIKNQRCAIFFGSGISAGSGLPTGRGLITELLEVQGTHDSDLSVVAQVARHRNGPNWLLHRLRTIFLEPELRPNDLHKILALLRCKYYITTNYDLLFDAALKSVLGCRDLPVVIIDDDIPYADQVTYIKLHGDIGRPDTIVLTYDDYDTRFESNPNLLHLLYSIFAQNLVLFVGYSLRDANVLSVVRKIGRGDARYSRGMYILVTDPDEEKADFFRSLNVQVVVVPRRAGESEGQALERFLLRLWNRTLDFDIYLNPEPRELTFTAKLEIAISSYRRGDYPGAIHLFRQLQKTPQESWRSDPGVFAQYAYFRLKTLDKLNRWVEMNQVGKELLALLSELGDLYPAPIFQSIRSQISASIGLPMLRATFFEEALSHLNEALTLAPDDAVIGKDAMLLHADRHTVRACIELSLSYFGECGSAEKLASAESNLAEAWRLFESFDSPNGENEAHFLGRYFGACAFLRIAALRHRSLRWTPQLGEELRDLGWKSHREIRQGKNRVPYGKLAGRYCEAAVDLAIAGVLREQLDDAGADASCQRAIERLQQLLAGTDESGQVVLSPLERCKFHRALELAWRQRAGDGGQESIAEADRHHDLFCALLRSDELRPMNHQTLADENWVYTPLN